MATLAYWLPGSTMNLSFQWCFCWRRGERSNCCRFNHHLKMRVSLKVSLSVFVYSFSVRSGISWALAFLITSLSCMLIVTKWDQRSFPVSAPSTPPDISYLEGGQMERLLWFAKILYIFICIDSYTHVYIYIFIYMLVHVYQLINWACICTKVVQIGLFYRLERRTNWLCWSSLLNVQQSTSALSV